MDKSRISVLLAILLAVVATIALVSEPATAVDTYWQATVPADWSSANWDNGEPVAGDIAYIDNGGTINITQSGETCYRLFIQGGSAGGGTVNMSSGDLYISTGASTPVFYLGRGGGGVVATWNHSGGTLTATSGTQVQVGTWSGGPTGGYGYVYHTGGTVDLSNDGVLFVGSYATGVYELTGGNAQLTTGESAVGYGSTTGGTGVGNFLQTAGTHTSSLLVVGGGWDDGGTGTYEMEGGNLNAADLWLGVMDYWRTTGTHVPVGTFTQSGGTVTVDSQVMLGSDETWYGFYYGTPQYVGAAGVGTYNYNGGTLTDGTNDADLIVRYDAPATGTFQGRGTVDLSGTLQNNGRVIADGGTLDMSSFGSVTSTIENTTTNGWFATNGGKLELPSLAVSADGSYNWGEDAGDAQIDLVNSVRTTFSGVSGSGDLDIDLLTPQSLLIGMWDISNDGFTFATADLTFRYDDALAVDESQLLLYHDSGAGWTEVPFTLDTANNLISTTGVTSFSKFAVGKIPEPSTLVLTVLGLLALGLHGRRRRA